MKTVNIILIALCIIGSTFCESKESFQSQFFNNFRNLADNNLDYSTSCSNINLPQYDGVTMSGYLNVGIKNSKSALSFIFFGAKGLKASELKSRTTLFWLNGGPGCSSQIGNFFELGPFQVVNNTDGSFNLTSNPNSWTNEYNVMFIDQPVGTGIAYAEKQEDIPINQTMVADQFYNGIVELYENQNGCFKQLGINAQTPLFIYGESYAGKYIPSIAMKMLQMGNVYKLRGVGIGDGFIDPYYITESIPQFALDSGMIDNDLFKLINANVTLAQKSMNQGNFTDAKIIFNSILARSNPQKKSVYNIFDAAKPDLSVIDDFINSKQGQNLFNLKLSRTYKQCDTKYLVYQALSPDFMKGDCVEKIGFLLESGLSVHIMQGDLDLIVPYIATQKLIDRLVWTYIGQNPNSYLPKVIRNGKEVYGIQQKFKNLIYTLVLNAGHMIPAEKPEVSMYLLKQHINSVLSQKN